MSSSSATPRSTRVPFAFILALLLLLGVTACRDADNAVAPARYDQAVQPLYSSQGTGGVIPDRYIVTFQPGVADPVALGRALANAHGGQVHYTYTAVLQGMALSVPAQALEGIRNNPNVKSIEPDQLVMAEGVQTPATWGIDRIDQAALPLNSTYNYETDAAGVTAYIFDTGIRYDHVEFEGRASLGYDAFGGTGADCHGHGTHVAGTVGGKTWGVAKKVTLKAVRVLDCTGYGSYSGMIAGMDWVVKNNRGPAVANFSLGGSVSSTLNNALTNMINAGVQTGVSAGNDGGDACLKSPASTAAAVTTGATTSSDARASYSNFGSCVDIFAPGSGITSASYSSTTGSTSMSGTSMAAPHVTGVLALLRALRPDMVSQQLRDWLVETLSTRNIVAGANSTNAHLLQSLTGGTVPPSEPVPPPSDPLPPPSDPLPPPPTEVPAAPSNAAATLAGKNVKVTWKDQSTNEDSFVVERLSGTEWKVLVTASANTTSITDGTVVKGVTYTYRVKAHNTAGDSPYSNSATSPTATVKVRK